MLVRLGGARYGDAMDKIMHQKLDPITEDHYKELLTQWKKNEDGILCPEVVRHTKALTMYRQFPGLITKMKQKIQNNWSHDPRVVCV